MFPFDSVYKGADHLEIMYDAYNYTVEEFPYIYAMFTDRKVRIGKNRMTGFS